MAPHVRIAEIHDDHVGTEITLKGWLYNSRGSKKVLFLQVRDGTNIIQCVVGRDAASDALWELAESLDQEASVIVTGVVQKDTRSALGYELHVTGLELLARGAEYPITPIL